MSKQASNTNAINTARTKRADKTQAEKTVITLTTKQLEWKAELFTAVAEYESAGVRLLNVVLDARRLKVPVEAVKALVTEAYMATGKCTEQTAKKRGSDAAVFIKVADIPKELPGNLQRAADMIRKQEREKKGQQRAPTPPGSGIEHHSSKKSGGNGKAGATNGEAKPATLKELAELIEDLRAQSFDETALDILAQMADLAGDLADTMAIDAEAS